MGKKANLEELKKEYIGKTFNWLTVLDVIRDNNKIVFKCLCKCNNIINIYYKYVLSGHTKSCSCFIHSKEHKNNLSRLYTDNPERIKNISVKRKIWCETHPNEVKEAAKKHSEWCKNNPDKVREHADKYSQWCKENPDKVKEKTDKYLKWFYSHPGEAKYITDKVSKWCVNNPEKIQERSKKYSDWCKSHREQLIELGAKHSEWMYDNVDDIIKKSSYTKKLHRKTSDFTALIEVIHPKYIEDLLCGNIKSGDIIETKCPVCGNYAKHAFHNVFRFRASKFKNNPPMCERCVVNLTSSLPEKEISNYISTFYSGDCIKNSRDIISPFELDLYYSEKKIAIEFNGDYFHSEDHKPNDYHYNKFKLCKERNILLVSIFEREWINNKDLIKSYLKDLFNNKENDLSFKDNMLNNNYPSPISQSDGIFIEDFYTYRNRKIFTCGYTKLN